MYSGLLFYSKPTRTLASSSAAAELLPSLCRAFAELLPSLCRALAEPLPSFCRALAELLSRFCRAFAEPLSSFCRALVELLPSPCRAFAEPLPSFCRALAEKCAISTFSSESISGYPPLILYKWGPAIIVYFPTLAENCSRQTTTLYMWSQIAYHVVGLSILPLHVRRKTISAYMLCKKNDITSCAVL